MWQRFKKWFISLLYKEKLENEIASITSLATNLKIEQWKNLFNSDKIIYIKCTHDNIDKYIHFIRYLSQQIKILKSIDKLGMQQYQLKTINMKNFFTSEDDEYFPITYVLTALKNESLHLVNVHQQHLELLTNDVVEIMQYEQHMNSVLTQLTSVLMTITQELNRV